MYCHKMSPKAKKTVTKIDDVEFEFARRAIEKAARFRRPSNSLRVEMIRLDTHVMRVEWKYTGQREGQKQRPIIFWMSAVLTPANSSKLPSPHELLHHIVAAAIVSALGGISTYVWANWPFGLYIF